MGRLTYVGRCVECGASLYYNAEEDKLVVKGKPAPGCLCHYEWPEDDREEEKKGEENGETDD